MKIFSGIQPSGVVHIGNYLGAMKNWAKLQDEHDSIFCIVDYHAITVDYDHKELPARVISAAKDVIASGVDPDKSIIFLQSDRPEHTELAWLLNALSYKNELERMTQYKEKSGQKRLEDEIKSILLKTDWKSLQDPSESSERLFRVYLEAKETTESKSTVGLFDYPVLMAADILIYDAEGVPVGEDQVQHIELTRDLASRFNNRFGQTFPEPKPLLTAAKRVGSLSGKGKMSKSDSPSTYIALTDDAETIRKKIASATTDQGNEANISPATLNLIGLMEEFGGKDVADRYLEERKKGTIKYSEFKPALAEAIIKELEPFQARRAEISDDDIRRIFQDGAAKLREPAHEKIQAVKEKMGLLI